MILMADEPAKKPAKTPTAAKPAPTSAAKASAKADKPAPPAAKASAKAEKAAAPGAAKGKSPADRKEGVKIVEAVSKAPEHRARAKPQISPQTRQALALRRVIDRRRPTFRRQQWYEYKRLEDSGWRYPRGVDSAMRRHFGYEQPVVRVGFRGPVGARGLHPSGFQEVHVGTLADLATINPKTHAARIARTLGTRKLKLVYAEADKRGIRILNRRKLE